MNTLDQLTTYAQQLVDELTKERAEIESIQRSVQTREEEVVRRNAQLIAERTSVLAQVEPLRQEQEGIKAKMLEAEKLKTLAKEEMERAEGVRLQYKVKLTDLDEREKLLHKAEESTATLLQREKALADEREVFIKTKEFITKQQTLLDEKQQSLEIREQQLRVKEERTARLYA